MHGLIRINNMLLDNIRKFCLENYEEGYDEVVEAYDDEELQEFIDNFNVTSVKSFIKEYQFLIDHRNDIRGA